MKADERRLLDELRQRTGNGTSPSPRDVATELGMGPKRCLTLCQGWWARRWLDRSPQAGRGEDFLTGQLTQAGMTANLDED